MTGFIIGVFVGGILVYLIMAVLILANDGWPTKPPKKRGTFRERLTKEYPDCVSKNFAGGCEGCPCDYGYEGKRESLLACKTLNYACAACWDREMPTTDELIEKQCRYLEDQAAKIGVEVVVTPNIHGDFDMQLKGSTRSYIRVSLEDKQEDFYLKAWSLVEEKTAD